MDIEFHTALDEPLAHVARLLRKAVRQGSRVCLATPRLDEVSRHLWSFEPREFLAHARPGAAASAWRRSALWLLPTFDFDETAGVPPGVWVNLGAQAPTALAGCERLIELLAADADATAAGRLRWRGYLALGHTPMVCFDGRRGAAQNAPGPPRPRAG